MKLATIVVALGVLLGVIVLAPNLLYSLSWDLSLVALVVWIAVGPVLMARKREQRTDAGWLADIGFSSTTVFLGCVAAIAGLFFSAQAIPVVPTTAPLAADAPAPDVAAQMLGLQLQPDLAAEKAALVVTSVSPGGRAETLRMEEGDRILTVNDEPVAGAANDPLELEAMRARFSADSVVRSNDSLKIALERDRQLLDLARQRLTIMQGRRVEPIDSAAADTMVMAQTDSVTALELRLNEMEGQSAAMSVAATALRAREQEAFQVLSRSGYDERRERRERLMFTRLARALRTVDEGKIVRLGVQTSGSTREVEVAPVDNRSFTYSTLGLAALIVGTAVAVGLSVVSKQGVEKIAAVNQAKSFESRHIVWQRQLTGAAAAASEEAARKALAECSEIVRYAGRDPSAQGTSFNGEVDAIVQSLCRSPAPSEFELRELGGTLRALIVQRENAIRDELTRATYGTQ